MSQALYQTDGSLHEHRSVLISVVPLPSLAEADRALFKSLDPARASHVLACRETIFHAQGGGQPSDEGRITSPPPATGAEGPARHFEVALVRHGASGAHDILHAGSFVPAGAAEDDDAAAAPRAFAAGAAVTQHVDPAKRALHSRLHTAGHLIGLAVRQLAAAGELPGVTDEGKARHFPGSANVECTGSIPEDMRPRIEALANEMVGEDTAVEIRFWSKEKCRQEGIWGAEEFKGDEVRVVDVVGRGAYMCGGTHLPRSKDVGEIVVGKIKRSKGISKISYDLKAY